MTLRIADFWSGVPGHDWTRERIDSISLWGFEAGTFTVADLRIE